MTSLFQAVNFLKKKKKTKNNSYSLVHLFAVSSFLSCLYSQSCIAVFRHTFSFCFQDKLLSLGSFFFFSITQCYLSNLSWSCCLCTIEQLWIRVMTRISAHFHCNEAGLQSFLPFAYPWVVVCSDHMSDILNSFFIYQVQLWHSDELFFFFS